MSFPGSRFAALVEKDLRVEFRGRQRWISVLGFTVLVPVLVHFGIDRGRVRPEEIAAGWIWMTLLFSGLLAMGRTFEIERDDGAFRGILLTPVPRETIFLAKVASGFLLNFGVALLALASFVVFFSIPTGRNPLLLVAILGTGTLGFTAIGTLLSGVTAGTSMGETLLPILSLPLMVPVIVYGVSSTAVLMAGLPPGEIGGSLRMLLAYDLVALSGGMALFRHVVRD